jgi:virginiamycin B lyase
MRPARLVIPVVSVCMLLVGAASPTQAARRGKEFPVPTAASYPSGITSGPDGNLWFTETDGNKIGRVTPSGVFTEFPIPTANSSPYAITSGPDRKPWFTEYWGNKIGRLTPSGAFT